MIDLKLARENLEEIKKKISSRGKTIDWDLILKLDDERKELRKSLETLRAKQNELSKSATSASATASQAIEVKKMIKDLEPKLAEVQEKVKLELVKIPNVPKNDVPVGTDETENKVLEEIGEIKVKQGKDYLELAKNLDLIDIERAVKVSGSRFYYLKNELVELEFALVRFALDLAKNNGFSPILPPVIIRKEMGWGTGHMEAISDDAYHLRDDEQVLVGTSEQSIIPYFAGETIEKLPQRFIGFSSCFRRESGSYGKDVKGILRVHQFDKIELISFCNPKESAKEHQVIIDLEEKVMQELKLPYRKVALCTGDLGQPSAKTIDIETWIPSEGKYRETHSSSNCTDYQARRLNIRFKNHENKSELAHTLNGTAIAVPRMLIAIMENYQNEDGSISVPEVLHKYLSFTKIG